ncbi:MAG: sortase [Anaerolineaceae bacterium]|nr:sortase [Anaerolineaceae bacterium]
MLQLMLFLALLVNTARATPIRVIPVTRAIEEETLQIGRNPLFPSTNLSAFIDSVKNGEHLTPVGIYADYSFAYPIVQQPNIDSVYVSTKPGVVTQFGMAARNGVIGLLAHNTLAGAQFTNLSLNQRVLVVYGDGTLRAYTIQSVRHFQALNSTNPYSDFVDQENPGRTLTSAQLFNEMYGSEETLVFQTCIQKDGNPSWGRLFILATPEVQDPGSILPRYWQPMTIH